MEIKGDEFIKKVQIKQEREELEQRLTEMSEAQTSYDNIPNKPPVQQEPPLNDISLNNNIEPEDEQELRDIRLNSTSSNEVNKKKYLVLGLILIVLFLSTILIIRLLNDDTPSKDNDFVNTSNNSTKTDETNIDEEYKKILDNRVNRQAQEEEEPLKVVKKEPIKLENIQEESIKDEDLEQIISQIKEKEVKKTVEKPKPKPVQKVVKKPEAKKVVKKETTVKRTVKEIVNSSPKGYFVQIGAFSKTPSRAYINKIRTAGFKYKIYKTEVKGRTFNKVLIGPYSSRAQASGNIDSIKNKLKLSSAYILKF